MDTQDLNTLNLKDEEGKENKRGELDVLNLKPQQNEQSIIYNNLSGTGVKPLRIISNILIVLGIILLIGGIAEIADASDYHPERAYIGMLCIYGAVSCFIISPLYKVLATIGEAAKIYKDKHLI